MYTCPICFKEHNSAEFKCSCGYERLKSYREEDFLFEIYKYSKNVFTNKIDFENSKLDFDETDNEIVIYEALGDSCSVSKVAINSPKYVKTDEGILPFDLQVKSLIIDVDEISRRVLDESNVQMIFLGKRVKKIDGENLNLCSKVKYIEVDSKNNYFSSDNNVLFDKDKKVLLNYARFKKEEEYYIPSTVKRVASEAFYECEYLKVIHASKKTVFVAGAIDSKNPIKIVYDL